MRLRGTVGMRGMFAMTGMTGTTGTTGTTGMTGTYQHDRHAALHHDGSAQAAVLTPLGKSN
jgi:hypothetical protein